jgi:drug/metabolite transporter (DMT)-like permease|tara:strand:+ start:685 stop:1050 length:366 start_codon:yes stop_codon:yes gene_type:complete
MTDTQRRSYRRGMLFVILGSIMICVLIGAVGIIGVEGDPFDRLYFALIGLGLAGGSIGRFKPPAMRYIATAMGIGMGLLALYAIVLGKHLSPVSSVVEILGLNGFFVLLFLQSARLFSRAD